jgi:GT2 family glycosyltransferase
MIYIIVPTFSKVDQTKKLINSIKKSIKNKYLVLLIDDHPKNLTFNAIDQNSYVKVVKSEKELWWVGSINLGVEILFNNYNLNDKDIIVFANNDVEIDKNSFEILQCEMEKNKNQMVHPRTFDQNGIEVSSGAKIFTFFPYITIHPKNLKKEKEIIDMGTARFLMLSGAVLSQVGYINKDLIQYGGDNDFTLSAKRFYNINTYILKDASCILDDTQTGIKNQNIMTVTNLYKSFFSIKSPNNFNYRYILFKKFFGKIGAFFITLSMTLNTIIKFFLRKK